ncbi:hypothetical protein C9413_32320, partial [Rhizobium sp. SEMIA 4085]|nr:hypothetical protein [Rhizobium sp. SEMIA 4085]
APAVHADPPLRLDSRPAARQVEPRKVAFGLARLALAEEEDVDHDVRAGVTPKTAFGQSNRGDQVGGPKAPNAVTPRPSPDDIALLSNISRVKGSLLIEKSL